MKQVVILFLIGVFGFSACNQRAQEVDTIGRRIFEQGISSSNVPIKATIAGEKINAPDIIACAHCHYRSGFGSREGTITARQIQGKALFRPAMQGSELLRQNLDKIQTNLRPKETRPAYTKATLAKALREGVDPSGRILSKAMPRFDLNNADMEHLITYLESLGQNPSAGVTETTISFATVITDDVEKDERDSLLLPLQAYVRTWNVDPRNQIARARNGFLHGASMYAGYRKIDLSIWELKGDPSTYEQQLAAFYKEKPVFALLSGMSKGSWKPIHDFCERNRIPNVFPITDLPVISDKDWYTLYFSKGLYQEGEKAAQYLAHLEHPRNLKTVQIYRNEPRSQALASGFRASQKAMGNQTIDIEIKNETKVAAATLEKLVEQHSAQAVAFWLGESDFALIENLAKMKSAPQIILVSSTQAFGKLSLVPSFARSSVYVVYPYSLTKMETRPYLLVRAWLRTNKLTIKNMATQVKAYFIVSMLTAAMTGMHSNFQRDNFLETFDMMIDQNYTIPIYPNLSFGPGQRYASKGCYVVQLGSEGDADALIPKSDWITF